MKLNSEFHFDLDRFNRYMVECESFSLIYVRFHRLRFNRYMVECEFNDYLII